MDAFVRAGVWKLTASVCLMHTHTHTHARTVWHSSWVLKQGCPRLGLDPCCWRQEKGHASICLPSEHNSHIGNYSGQPRSALVTAASKSTYRSFYLVSVERARGHNTVGDCGNDCSPRSSVVYLSSLKDQFSLISHCPNTLRGDAAFYMEVFDRTSNLSLWLIIGPNRA